MATKKRLDRSQSAPEGSLGSPFAKLAALKGALPEGAPPNDGAPDEGASAPRAAARKLVVRRERSGRAGKTVTVVDGLALDDDGLRALAKDMKRALGCGATVEGGALVLQGDLEERAAAFLEQRDLGRVVFGTRKR